jgi:hypothetical protein
LADLKLAKGQTISSEEPCLLFSFRLRTVSELIQEVMARYNEVDGTDGEEAFNLIDPLTLG